MTIRLGVLASGNGSNLQAILDAIARGDLDARCELVLTNRPHAYAIERAKKAGVRTCVLDHTTFSRRQEFDQAAATALHEAGVQWVALAGFMRVLSASFLNAFQGRVVNIHPSLLPAFPGVNAQKQAFDYGVKLAGCTVHFVDGGVDSGPIILQRCAPRLDDDTLEQLKARILKQEHLAFVEALQLIASGQVTASSGERHIKTGTI